MTAPQKIKPTEAEIEILQVLWSHGPSTVRYVNDQLKTERNVGYTTTLKLMQIMTEKGMLARSKSSRSHIYTPLIEEKETKNQLINKFVSTLFGGSASKMVLQALGNQECTHEELEEIRSLIDQMENTKPDELDSKPTP